MSDEWIKTLPDCRRVKFTNHVVTNLAATTNEKFLGILTFTQFEWVDSHLDTSTTHWAGFWSAPACKFSSRATITVNAAMNEVPVR